MRARLVASSIGGHRPISQSLLFSFARGTADLGRLRTAKRPETDSSFAELSAHAFTHPGLHAGIHRTVPKPSVVRTSVATQGKAGVFDDSGLQPPVLCKRSYGQCICRHPSHKFANFVMPADAVDPMMSARAITSRKRPADKKRQLPYCIGDRKEKIHSASWRRRAVCPPPVRVPVMQLHPARDMPF